MQKGAASIARFRRRPRDSGMNEKIAGRAVSVAALALFEASHHCRNPRPADELTLFLGLRCLSCGYEIVIYPWSVGGSRRECIMSEPIRIVTDDVSGKLMKVQRRECIYCGAESDFVLCDEPECEREVTCGTPTPDGYRSTCGEHMPRQKSRQSD